MTGIFQGFAAQLIHRSKHGFHKKTTALLPCFLKHIIVCACTRSIHCRNRLMCASVKVIDDEQKTITPRNETLHEQVHEHVLNSPPASVEKQIADRLNPDVSLSVREQLIDAPQQPQQLPEKKPYSWPLTHGHISHKMSKHRDILLELAEKEGYTPETFKKAIELHKQIVGPRGSGNVEFVEKTLGQMKRFGVVRDFDAYKQLLGIFPKKIMLPENFIEAEFFKFPQHQTSAMHILDYMHRHGMSADDEIYKEMCQVFGKHSHVCRIIYQQFYWTPKLRYIDENEVKDDRLQLADFFHIEERILRRMCRDDRTQYHSVWTRDIEGSEDDTYFVSAQSPMQRQLIVEHPADTPMTVEGGFSVWFKARQYHYFQLTSPVTERCRRMDEYLALPPPEEDFDIPYDVQFTGVSGELAQRYEQQQRDARARDASVHEQTDGTVLALVMTGSGSKQSVESWLRYLTAANPSLAHVPVVFKLRTPPSGVVVHDGFGQFDVRDAAECSEKRDKERNTSGDVPVLYVDYSS